MPSNTAALPASATPSPTAPRAVSEHQAREADDAYLAGARAVERSDFTAAETDFARAVQLNPSKPEYLQSLAVLREHRVTDLVQQAAQARRSGDAARADALLAQARALDPDNSIVTQHFDAATRFPEAAMILPANLPGSGTAPHLGGPIQLTPRPTRESFHTRGDVSSLLRVLYSAYGVNVTFDSSFTGGRSIRLDLDDVDFATATGIADKMAGVFAVPLQPKSALIAKDDQESRDRLLPLVEETLYVPGLSGDAVAELANVARQVFDLKQVTASQTAGDILLRGDERTLKLLNATYADMLDGGSDVQLDISLYELDKTHIRNIGASTPSSLGIFSVYGELQSLLTANASVIQAAISAGALTLTGDAAVDIPKEIAILAAAGDLNISQFTQLLGTIGSFGGVPLAGVFLGSASTFNLLLNSSDVRTLDFAQLRAGNHQPANFRAGTRYPVITGTYSSGLSSALTSQIAGISSSAAALLSQYVGTTSVSIPQFQYEDLGLTVKATPSIQSDGNVYLQLDMKLEALGGSSLNNIPILNNRALTSNITVPSGQTVLLASEVTSNELRSINGVPGLSELPGFQGTDRSTEKDSSELLITITPHIVREGRRETSSRPLLFDKAAGTP